jgi:DNA-directed RNA polymerase specialized sigma24 family protein
LIIRAGLRYGFRTRRRRQALDARVAIGIGTVDFLPRGRGSEGDGEAFRRSGPVLDEMRYQRLSIRTPWPELDAEFQVECALLDALIERWSAEQAQAIVYLIAGWTQEKIAGELRITQPAVRQRLKSAGGSAVQKAIERYKLLIHRYKSGGL